MKGTVNIDKEEWKGVIKQWLDTNGALKETQRLYSLLSDKCNFDTGDVIPVLKALRYLAATALLEMKQEGLK